MNKDQLVFIKHIRDAIKLIEDFTSRYVQKNFLHDDLVQSAVVRQIEIMGEATKNISESFKKDYPKIPWSDLAGMRDKLIHGYFGVDFNRVWKVVREDVPKLKKQITEILEKEERKE